ncbi:hypothetical protein, partial [Phocaeicola plebeius]|uniref:hypothetical protein n=1 Tax=Phocaeicola plebeius TaxID=310297 RepID=UPI003AF0A5D1
EFNIKINISFKKPEHHDKSIKVITVKYSNFHSLWFKAITQSALIKVALVHSSQRSDKFSVSHCGICISQCEICIPQCGFYISQCETENLH